MHPGHFNSTASIIKQTTLFTRRCHSDGRHLLTVFFSYLSHAGRGNRVGVRSTPQGAQRVAAPTRRTRGRAARQGEGLSAGSWRVATQRETPRRTAPATWGIAGQRRSRAERDKTETERRRRSHHRPRGPTGASRSRAGGDRGQAHEHRFRSEAVHRIQRWRQIAFDQSTEGAQPESGQEQTDCTNEGYVYNLSNVTAACHRSFDWFNATVGLRRSSCTNVTVAFRHFEVMSTLNSFSKGQFQGQFGDSASRL